MVVFGFISRRIERYKKATADGAQIMWDNFFKGGLFALIAATIIWISVFLYIAFYYYYMPSIHHHRQVNLQFKTCEEKGSGICSFPTAHVQLTKFQQLLMIGQTYRIYLKLEMPESPANKQLGMFMVCAQLADKNAITVSHSCRSAMLHYRSELLSVLSTLTFYPLLVFGNIEEKQTLTLELYSNYEEDQNHPVTDLFIELQAHQVEYYSASIHIQAHLKGLRYLMFHWPLVTAALGISSNLFFIIFIVSVSWWQIFGPRDEYGRRLFYPGTSFRYIFQRHVLTGNMDYEEDDDDDDDDDEEEEYNNESPTSDDVNEESNGSSSKMSSVETEQLKESELPSSEKLEMTGSSSATYTGRQMVSEMRKRPASTVADDSVDI